MVFIDDKFIGLPFINRTVTMVIRSSHRRCSVKKAAPNNFGIFTKKYRCWTLFLRPATLLKRNSNTGVFLWILRSFKNTYYENICKQFLLVIHYYNKINPQSFQLQIKRFFSVNIDNIMALYWSSYEDNFN